jgi:twitching motility protein PilT
MALVDSLLTAMVRANGDALVMHVGEKPYVVTESRTIDLSTHGLNLSAMVGMLAQLLPSEAQGALQEFGAVEHELPPRGADRFAVVAARGGDDIWIEIRRRREEAPAPIAEPPVAPREPELAALAAAAAADVAPSADAIAQATEAQTPLSPAAPIEEPVARPEEPEVAPVAAAVQVEEPPAVAEVEEPAAGDVARTQASEILVDAPLVVDDATPVATAGAADFELTPAPEILVDASQAAEEAASDATVGAPDEAPELQFEPDVRDDVVSVAPDPDESLVMAPPPSISPDVAEEHTMYNSEFPQPHASHQAGSDAHATSGAPVSAAPQSPTPMYGEHQQHPLSSVHPASVGAAPRGPDVAWRDEGGTMAPPPPTAQPSARARVDEGPLTRTVRIEVPSRPMTSRPGGPDRLLRAASALGASDLLLTSQARPFVRVAGELRPLEGEPPLSSADIEAMLSELGPDAARDAWRQGRGAEWSADIADVGSVLFSTFWDHRGFGAICRLSASSAAPVDRLGLAPEALALTTEPDGLIVVSGPRGSGKSTMLAAFVDAINRQRADYVITLEAEIRLLHENHQALISQREYGGDASAAARAAARENPDVLVFDDLDSPEAAAIALDAAAQGTLVIVALTGASTTGAVAHLLELVPVDRRAAARAQLATTFRGALAQVLLRKAGGGRQAARELLLGTGQVTRLLQEGRLAELPAVFEAGRRFGMNTLTDVLTGYVQAGVVDVREAYRKAPEPARLLAGLRAAGVDTTLIDRIA